jgi:hypothetical protein
MLPINFQKTPDGGSCMPGCHEARTYTRTRAEAGPEPVERFGPNPPEESFGPIQEEPPP